MGEHDFDGAWKRLGPALRVAGSKGSLIKWGREGESQEPNRILHISPQVVVEMGEALRAGGIEVGADRESTVRRTIEEAYAAFAVQSERIGTGNSSTNDEAVAVWAWRLHLRGYPTISDLNWAAAKAGKFEGLMDGTRLYPDAKSIRSRMHIEKSRNTPHSAAVLEEVATTVLRAISSPEPPDEGPAIKDTTEAGLKPETGARAPDEATVSNTKLVRAQEPQEVEPTATNPASPPEPLAGSTSTLTTPEVAERLDRRPADRGAQVLLENADDLRDSVRGASFMGLAVMRSAALTSPHDPFRGLVKALRDLVSRGHLRVAADAAYVLLDTGGHGVLSATDQRLLDDDEAVEVGRLGLEAAESLGDGQIASKFKFWIQRRVR